jgi:hypothetical protein
VQYGVQTLRVSQRDDSFSDLHRTQANPLALQRVKGPDHWFFKYRLCGSMQNLPNRVHNFIPQICGVINQTTLTMEAVRTSETSVYYNAVARRYIPEGCLSSSDNVCVQVRAPEDRRSALQRKLQRHREASN